MFSEMVQHRGLLSVVAGSLLLTNLSSILGYIVITFFQERDHWVNQLKKMLEIFLPLMIQTFTLFLGSVYAIPISKFLIIQVFGRFERTTNDLT
jgi:hypothetical protein